MGGKSLASAPEELNSYVGLADSTFDWKVATEAMDTLTLRITSQTWRGVPWVHSLRLVSWANASNTAVLYLTGGEPNPLDDADAEVVAAQSGLPTAMLFNIPAQPIFGKAEDELIAYTFDAFLKDGDATWPLLFPMAKSVVRAMDAIESWSQGRLRRFVLMGESKRAWTAWMAAGTGDPRIIGIAPAAFDNLNLVRQLAHQIEIWERFSPAIHDYTDLNLQARLGSGEGKRLAGMVDPYSYLSRIRAKVLQVHGTNDEYWAPDAHSLYREALPIASTLLILPNEGHTFGQKSTYYRTVGAFANSCAAGWMWPELGSKLDELNILTVNAKSGEGCESAWIPCRLYLAESETADFSNSRWDLCSEQPANDPGELRFVLPKLRANFQASFVQADFRVEHDGLRWVITLSTPTRLLRR